MSNFKMNSWQIDIIDDSIIIDDRFVVMSKI